MFKTKYNSTLLIKISQHSQTHLSSGKEFKDTIIDDGTRECQCVFQGHFSMWAIQTGNQTNNNWSYQLYQTAAIIVRLVWFKKCLLQADKICDC